MFRIIPRQSVSHLKGQLKIMLKEKISVERFENKLASYININNVVAVGSATLAFYLILKNIKKTNKDEVILSRYNYYDLANVIDYCGMKPVFIEVDESLQMNISEIKNKISKNTRAILVTHLFGFHSDIKSILKTAKKNNIYVVEDGTHALGSSINNKKIGSFGDFGMFSFNRWKIMDCFGGGVIVSNNDAIMKNIRNEISKYKYPNKNEILRRIIFNYVSWILTFKLIFSLFIFPIVYLFNLFNKDTLFDLTKDDLSIKFSNNKKLRFSELQATIGYKMIDNLDFINKERENKYRKLIAEIKNRNVKTIEINGLQPIFFPIIVKNKKFAYDYLLKNGIDTISKYYGYNLDKNKNVEDNLILIPVHINVNNSDIDYIADCINKI
ncbi:aminotransferase class V-fold PLP-dependent enzyme [Candidatus Woesearchaeota archaeon]|nr:aminotransferase class V-fold PLP-dependent enzyme [Candidatus Woesearchaeota archaeon]